MSTGVARDAKAERGELRFTLPPGYCWGASGRIEIDPDERVAGAIQLVFEKFRELGSGRQVHLWFLDSGLSLPVVRRNHGARQIEWRPAAYHSVHQILKNPIYAGAYVFGRRGTRTKIVDGRARKSGGHQRAMADWGVLLRDNHEVWNAPTTSTGTKQRLIRTLIEEVIIDLDDEANEAVVTIHWVGGRHSETRVPRVRIRRYPADPRPAAADVMRKLGGQWPDRELAVTMNRMRCRSEDSRTWTTVQVRDLRERLGIAVFDPETAGAETVSADEAAHRLGVSVESVRRLIREEKLPATQLMPLAPWKIPVEGLESEAVRIGVREIIARRPGNVRQTQDVSTLRLPGI